MRAVDLHSRRLVEEHGLTGPQLATLREAARLGNVSVSALSRAVHLSQPTVTGILDRLERRRWIQRSRDTEDRRTVKVLVTVEGYSFLNRAPSLLQDRFRSELAKLQEWEQTMTLATLQRIAEMMEADSLDASPVLVAGPVEAGTASPSSGGPSNVTVTETKPQPDEVPV
jgi:DNA-binding MarR family transcriptional regulator